jgi:Domain of unknown function (DUF3846)
MANITVLHCVVGKTPEVKTVDDKLESLQALVGGYIEMVRMRHSLACLCDEEGILKERPSGYAVMSTMGFQPIRGDFFICRLAGSKFKSLSESDIVAARGDVIPRMEKE